ncbi:heme-binding protein [Brevundimonas sp.]|uniref:SOUL family heme-binding protein n=1 Tax=Brevundimonas sp. TaxID=1871086 RepID=UPI00286A9CC3|nr:heme-binding protein [Brevundimonas sp.]
MKRLILTLLLMLCTVGTPAMATEEPKFTLVMKDGDFEIRDYLPNVVAEVTVSGSQDRASSQGFRILAGYIFGGNTRRQSIAMTAPVAQNRTSETIAMTAPVTQTATGGNWAVRFIMPSEYTMATLPVPDDGRITLREEPAQRMAVIRFSGIADGRQVERREQELDEQLARRGLRRTGPTTLAQYDPPWTLWFMRRNEVMAPVAR